MNSSINKPSIIIVLGMHRSGTSVLAGLVHMLGAQVGEDMMSADSNNEKGYWEDLNIVSINDRILQTFNLSWDSTKPLPSNWEHDNRLNSLKIEANTLLNTSYFPHSCSVIKDPRMCRLLQFWLPLFEQANFNIKILITLRSPKEVAASLKKRDQFPILYTYLLWFIYNIELENASRHYSRTIITYDNLLNNPLLTLENICNELKLDFLQAPSKFSESINQFLDKGLRHHKKNGLQINDIFNLTLTRWMNDIYKLFLSIKKPTFYEEKSTDFLRLNKFYEKIHEVTQSDMKNPIKEIMLYDKDVNKQFRKEGT